MLARLVCLLGMLYIPIYPLLAVPETTIEELLVEGMEQGILGDYQRAIAIFTQVIQYAPNSAEAYYNRGLAYLKSGNPQAAIADYNQAIKLEPTLAEAYLEKGKLLHSQGDRALAITYLRQAAELFLIQNNSIAHQQTLLLIQNLEMP